jgi:Ulp1 family protease
MADMDEKKLFYYDSMSKVNSVENMQDKVLSRDGDDYEDARKYLSGALSLIVEEGKLRDVAVNSSEWRQVVVATPQQGKIINGEETHGVNCGVFMILFADFLTDDLPFSFLNSDMPMFRRKVAAAILRGYLDYDRVPGEIVEVEVE